MVVVVIKPFRFTRVHYFIVVPLKSTKVCQLGEVILVASMRFFFIVDVGQKQIGVVETVEVPPHTEVVSRCTKPLNNTILDQIAGKPIQRPAVPILAQLVGRDSL